MRTRLIVTACVLLLLAGAVVGTGLVRHTQGPLFPVISPLHETGSTTDGRSEATDPQSGRAKHRLVGDQR